MVSLVVEVQCPLHGFERFRVKIIKRTNIPSNEIVPKVKMRPRIGEISCLYIGRDISYAQAEDYLINYFRETKMGEIVGAKRML